MRERQPQKALWFSQDGRGEQDLPSAVLRTGNDGCRVAELPEQPGPPRGRTCHHEILQLKEDTCHFGTLCFTKEETEVQISYAGVEFSLESETR